MNKHLSDWRTRAKLCEGDTVVLAYGDGRIAEKICFSTKEMDLVQKHETRESQDRRGSE